MIHGDRLASKNLIPLHQIRLASSRPQQKSRLCSQFTSESTKKVRKKARMLLSKSSVARPDLLFAPMFLLTTKSWRIFVSVIQMSLALYAECNFGKCSISFRTFRVNHSQISVFLKCY